MRPLAEVDVADLQHVWRTNIGGPLVLTSALLPWLREADGVLLSISSDAAVHHYETWGLYGASKAALDHVTLTYAAETGLDGVRRRPRRHAHRDAPGRLPRRGHLRPAAAGDGRCRACWRCSSAGPRRGRYRAEDLRMTLLDETPHTAFTAAAFAPAAGRGARARRATRCACSSRPRTACPTRHFRDLPDHLRAGDVLVVNTSATVPAEVDAVLRRAAGRAARRAPSRRRRPGGRAAYGARRRARPPRRRGGRPSSASATYA